jgi:hypothetical protein
MEKSEQRLVMKFSFIKSLPANKIHRELTNVLRATACPLSQMKERRFRFAQATFRAKTKSGPVVRVI